MTIRTLVVIPTLVILLASAGAADAVQLKIATLAPDGSSWLNEVRTAADEIAQRTQGRVTLRFYPGGSMGDEEAVLKKIRIGQLHGSAMTSGTLSIIYPDIQIYSMPLLFSSFEEVDRVRVKLDPKLIAALDDRGYHCYGFIEGGFAYLMSTEKVKGISDLKGRKAWLREGDAIGQAVVKAAGLSPIPLPLTDVLTGLQTGLIDTVAGPPVAAVALQWFTKVKYLTDLPLIYTYGTLVIANKALQRVSEEDRQVIQELLSQACQRLDKQGRKENDAALEALQRQGMTIVEAPPGSMEEWQELAATATSNLVKEGSISAEIHAEAEAILQSQGS